MISVMKKWMRSFTEHPASVNETYTQHLASAWSFSFRMLLAALACFVHGLLPPLFMRTGSNAVRELHERMVADRTRSN